MTIQQLCRENQIYKLKVIQLTKERQMLECDYNARLKDDMAAMLTELQLEIEEKAKQICDDGWWLCYNWLIQQKINEIKGNQEGKE